MIRVPDLLSRAAYRFPDAPAVSYGGETFSWTTLERRVWQVAAGLRDLGVKPGDRVVYLGHNSHRQFESFYAPARIGAIILPMNTRLSLAEMIDCAHDCTPTLILADRNFVDQAKAIAGACPSVQCLIFADQGPAPEGMTAYDGAFEGDPDIDPTEFDDLASSDDDTLILFYTSGTTGRPKGVMLTHQNIHHNAVAGTPLYQLYDGMTHLLSGPMFHLASGGRAYTSVFSYGHSVILPRFDVEEVMHAVQTYRANLIMMVPTMVTMLLDHPKFADYDLSSLELISYGAAPMPAALISRALEALPGVAFVQGYGMTESSPLVSALTRDYHRPGGPGFDKINSVGKPINSADLRIVDEDGAELPRGEIGEIIIRGPMIMKGYWNNPSATTDAIRGGFYHSGDAGYLDEDGFLYIAGRKKEMIISGGENVYPIETENALSRHPDVDQCAVFGMPDDYWGERVHAEVLLHDGSTATTEDLIAFCRAAIADYKCPRSISYRDTPMPVGTTNKIDKPALRNALLKADDAKGPHK